MCVVLPALTFPCIHKVHGMYENVYEANNMCGNYLMHYNKCILCLCVSNCHIVLHVLHVYTSTALQ